MPAKTTKPRALRAPRKAPAKAVQADRGNLSKPEIQKLLMQAQEAYHFQLSLGIIDPAEKFDTWRRDQVMAAVNLPGLTKIFRSQWRTVFAHFLTLSGHDAEAFMALTTTGPKRDHGPADDTHESAEALVHHMRQALADHATQPVTEGRDHLHPGWLLAAARQRSGRPTLTWDTMAERLDPRTLTGLLSHLRNHIARREGREIQERRAPRVYPPNPDAGDLDGTDFNNPF